MTSSLRSLQDELLALLLTDAPADRASLLAAGSPRLAPFEQVAIYREQIRDRLCDSLRHDFSTLASLLGTEPFDRLADAYLARHPPTSYTLRDLGAHLPSALTDLLLSLRYPPSFTQLAHDLASLEWAAIEASDAPDTGPLDRALLASLSPEQLDVSRLHFAPSLLLLSLAYPVHTLPLSPPPLAPSDPLPLAPAPTFLALSRLPDHGIDITPLTSLEHAALSRLRAGQPLAAALDDLASTLDPDAVAHLGASLGPWFASWVDRGWLCALT